jgi:hypothetical protein
MAKAIKAYSGYDSCGRRVCLAQRVDGAWFQRAMEQTGYGCQWTKWQKDEAPTHPTKIKCTVECADSPDYREIPECERENYAEWGFVVLTLGGHEGFRLPNAVN